MYEKYSLPVSVRDSKTYLLKLSNDKTRTVSEVINDETEKDDNMISENKASLLATQSVSRSKTPGTLSSTNLTKNRDQS